MQRHVVEGGDGEDDAGVACRNVVSIEVLSQAMVVGAEEEGGGGGRA